jgi:uncharacterized protein (TIGR02246 family)
MSSTSEAALAAHEIVTAMVHAWNAHDAHAFAAIFARDADFTNVFGMGAEGREEVERFHRPIFETMFKDSCLAAIRMRTRPVRSDVAAVDVHWEMSGACDPAGNQWPNRLGLMSLLITREQGCWAIAVMHNMELPPDGMADGQARLQERHVRSGAEEVDGIYPLAPAPSLTPFCSAMTSESIGM